MIKLEFSEAVIQGLHYECYHYPHPRVQRKMEALWLKSQELSHNKIAQLTGITSKTLTSYLQEYKDGGIEKLKEIKFYGPVSKLKEHTCTIEQYFREYPPSSIREAMGKMGDYRI